MSFFRPEAARLVWRWTETGIYVAVTGLGLWWLLAAAPAPAAWRWGLAAVAALAGGWFIRAAALSALAAGEGEAPGVVEIDERRVAYWGPREGGVIALDEIASIDISVAGPGDWSDETVWALRPEASPSAAGGAALLIPTSAVGAERLIDAFAALPGFAPARAISALRSRESAMVTIWRRPAAPGGPALARLPGRD